ncbi:unnamed protein product [Caenorhabditis brenneri]
MNKARKEILQLPTEELGPESDFPGCLTDLINTFWWSIILVVDVIGIGFICYWISLLFKYHSAYWRSKWVHQISDEPYVLHHSTLRRIKEDPVWKRVIPQVKIYCDSYKPGNPLLPNYAILRMNSIMKKIFDLKIEYQDSHSTKLVKETPIPDEACTISIAMDGFVHGKLCHEFAPLRKRIRGSHFRFQMYGDHRIQVTYFIEDDIRYIAGLCIYIRHPQDWGVNYRLKFIQDCMNSTKYPARSQRKIEGFHTRELTVEYCRVARRNMLTAFKPDGAYHQEWNHNLDVMTIEKCHRCTNRANRDRPPTYFSVTMNDETGQPMLSRSL